MRRSVLPRGYAMRTFIRALRSRRGASLVPVRRAVALLFVRTPEPPGVALLSEAERRLYRRDPMEFYFGRS